MKIFFIYFLLAICSLNTFCSACTKKMTSLFLKYSVELDKGNEISMEIAIKPCKLMSLHQHLTYKHGHVQLHD